MTDRMGPTGESRLYSRVQEDHGPDHIRSVEGLVPGARYVFHQPAIRFRDGRFIGLEDQPREMVVRVLPGETSHVDPDGLVSAILKRPGGTRGVTYALTPVDMGMEPGEEGFPKGAWVEHIPNELTPTQLRLDRDRIRERGMEPFDPLGRLADELMRREEP